MIRVLFLVMGVILRVEFIFYGRNFRLRCRCYLYRISLFIVMFRIRILILGVLLFLFMGIILIKIEKRYGLILKDVELF